MQPIIHYAIGFAVTSFELHLVDILQLSLKKYIMD